MIVNVKGNDVSDSARLNWPRPIYELQILRSEEAFDDLPTPEDRAADEAFWIEYHRKATRPPRPSKSASVSANTMPNT